MAAFALGKSCDERVRCLKETFAGRQAHLYVWVLFAVVLLLVGVIVYTARAEGPYGLLKNGGFEEGFYGWGPNDSQVPNGWQPFVIQDPSAPPQFKDSAAFGGFVERLDGEHALIIWSHWVPFDAGVYQQVQVTPGTGYVAAIEWAPMQSFNPEAGGKVDGDYIARVVGLDPAGGTDPNAPSVVWCQELWKQKRATKDRLKISVVAQSNTMTVFLRVKNPQPHGQDQVFFDVVSLNVDASAPTAPPPTDTPAPVVDTPVPPTRTPRPPTATAPPPTDTPTTTPTFTTIPTDTPVPPTSTATPIPATPTATRTPKPAPTPVSWIDNPPPTLTGALLAVGIGSEGMAFILVVVLGIVWWSGHRPARRMKVRPDEIEYGEDNSDPSDW